MKNKNIILLLLILIFVITDLNIVEAQCAMCKLSAETNMKNGGTQGKGLNAGILYLLCLPYLLFSVFALVWWRKKKSINP